MRALWLLPVLSLSLLSSVGCGGSKRKLGASTQPSSAQMSAAQTLDTSITRIAGQGSDNKQGPALAAELYSAGTSATAENVKQGLEGTHEAKDFTDPTCVTTSGGKTTYNNCMQTGGGGNVNGSITVTGELGTTLTVDYDNLKVGSGSGDLVMDGAVTMTPTTLDGTLTISINATVSGAGAKTTVVIDYNAVSYSACGISAGVVRIDWDYKVSSVGGIGVGTAGNLGGSVEMTWTACDTFTVRNS